MRYLVTRTAAKEIRALQAQCDDIPPTHEGTVKVEMLAQGLKNDLISRGLLLPCYTMAEYKEKCRAKSC